MYTIKVSGGTYKSEKFLSTNQNGDVSLWSKDTDSGRQHWELVKVGPDTYNIKVYGGTNKGEVFLSSAHEGWKVFLFHEDNGSGRQQWTISNLGLANIVIN